MNQTFGAIDPTQIIENEFRIGILEGILEWMVEKAAEQGDGKAQFNLGIRYDNAQGVVQDDTRAAGDRVSYDWQTPVLRLANTGSSGPLSGCRASRFSQVPLLTRICRVRSPLPCTVTCPPTSRGNTSRHFS